MPGGGGGGGDVPHLYFEEIADGSGLGSSITKAPFAANPVFVGYEAVVGNPGSGSYGDDPGLGWGAVETPKAVGATFGATSGGMLYLIRTSNDMLIPAVHLCNQILCFSPATKVALWTVLGWASLTSRRLYRPLMDTGTRLLAWWAKFDYYYFTGIRAGDEQLAIALAAWKAQYDADPNKGNPAYESQFDAQVDAVYAGYTTEPASDYYHSGTSHGYGLHNAATGSEESSYSWTQNSGDGSEKETTLFVSAVVATLSFTIPPGGPHPYEGQTMKQVMGVGAHQRFNAYGTARHSAYSQFPLVYFINQDFNNTVFGGFDPIYERRYKFWMVIQTVQPFTYAGSSTEMPWDPWDCVLDGHVVVFLPGRSATKFPRKVAAAFDMRGMAKMWEREFTEFAGTTVVRSNGAAQAGLVHFFMQGFWYALEVAGGAIVKKVAVEGNVLSDQIRNDLMIADGKLVYLDDSASPSMKLKVQS